MMKLRGILIFCAGLIGFGLLIIGKDVGGLVAGLAGIYGSYVVYKYKLSKHED